MKLNEKQVETIKQACEEIEYGAITIKLNKELKFVDIIVENRLRLQSVPTVNNADPKEKRYEK